MRLLIVDDDHALVRLLTLLLRSDDLDVVGVTSVREGLDEIGRWRPDLILLDLMMPESSGREFYRAARSAGYDGPIVICSAYGAHAAQRELGAQAAIEKPFEIDEVVDLVSQLLAETSAGRSNGRQAR